MEYGGLFTWLPGKGFGLVDEVMRMRIDVTVQLSPAIEERIRATNPDLPAAVRESFLIDLFRRGILDRQELAQSLGLDRLETLALLKHHGVFEGALSHEEVTADATSVMELIRPGSK